MNYSRSFQQSGIQMTQVELKDFEIDGPINDSINAYFAKNKTDSSIVYLMKKIIFTTPSERQVCLTQIQQQSNLNLKGFIFPKAMSLEMREEHEHILYLFYEKREGSLKEDIEKRQRTRNFYSTNELKGIIEYSFEQLHKLILKNASHLNIKPSNMIQNNQGYYSFSEGGYPSQNVTLENDVFRSPQLLEYLKDKKPILKISSDLKESSDIFSLGLCYVQAATLMTPKQLRCFNDESYSPQESKEVLETIQKRYGNDLFKLVSIMTSYDDDRRQSLDAIKNKEFRNFQESEDKEFKGGPDSLDDHGTIQATPEDDAFVKKIKQKCAQYCENRSQTLPDFFSKSDQYDKITKTITKYEFRRLIELMDIRLTDYEVKSINRVLDPNDTGKYNMLEFFRDSNVISQSNMLLSSMLKDDLPSLGSEEEELLLQSALKKAYNFIKRENINIESQLKEEDSRQTGWLTFQQFNKVMNINNIIFREAEFNSIKVKFDLEFKKERIQYLKFLEAMKKSFSVGDQELKDQLNILFQSIYKNFKSFDDFLHKQAKDNQSYISFAAFTTYLSYDGLNITDKMNSKLKELLDPHMSGQIYLSQIKEVFQTNIESHLLTIITDLANQLDKKNLSFSGFIQNYFPKSYYIKVATFAEKSYEVLRCNIERKDVSFMLEYFKIQSNTQDEFHINKLKEEIASFAKKNKIVYAQQIFGDSNAPLNESTRQKRDSDANLRGSEMQNTYGKKKDYSFSAIIADLKEAARSFKRQDILKFYGLSDRKNVSLNYDTFKKYLEFFKRMEESETSILFNQLSKNINNVKVVDAVEFLSLLDIKTYDEADIKPAELVGGFNINDVQKYSPVFIEINRLLKDRGVSAKSHFLSHQSIVQRSFVEDRLRELKFKVDDFGREFDMIFQQIGGRIDKIEIQKFVDVVNHFENIASTKVVLIENKSSIVWFIKIYKAMQDTSISMNAFNRLISGSDRISQDDFAYKIERELGLRKDDNYQIFLESISHKNGDISFTKFEEGYIKEEKALKALNDMRMMTKSSQKTISQAFSNIDINGDGLISKNEFFEMMPIINSSMNKEDLNYLFERLDLNNSGNISLDEFRDNIMGKDALKNQQEYENNLRSFYQELQQVIHNSRKTFDDLFLDQKEKQMTTAEFEKILGKLGQRLDDKQKIQMVMEDLTFGGVIFNRMRLKKKYQKYIDNYKEQQYSNSKSSSMNGNNTKQDAYEFVKIIKNSVKSQNVYFDDVFNRRKSYQKSDFSDLLYSKLNLNTKRYSDIFDNFWSYFKDQYNNELEFKLFEDVYNDLRENTNESNRGQGRDNFGGKDNYSKVLDRFLADNAKDCDNEFQRFDEKSITTNEFLRAIKKVGLDQQFREKDIEDYCQDYNAVLKNGQIDYPFLLEKVKRKQRDERNDDNNRRERNRDDYEDRQIGDRDFDRNKSQRDQDRNRQNDDKRNRFRDDNEEGYERRRRNERDDDEDRNQKFRNERNDQIRRRNDNDDDDDEDDDNRRNQGRQTKQYDKRDYQKAIKNFLEQMIQSKCNIFDVIRDAKLDQKKEGLVDERDFWEEMKLKRVKISSTDQEIIGTYVTNNKRMLDYQKLDGDIRAFIEQARKARGGDDKKKKKKKMKSDELNKIIDEFRKDMQKYLESKNVGVRYIFKRFDKDSDNFISFSEFENALKDNRLCPFFEQYEQIDGIVENIFDVFDEEKELKIDLSQFTKVLFPQQSNIQIEPIMKQFKTLMSGTTEEDLRREYQKIDKNEDGKIQFNEFQKYLKSFTKGKMSDIEIESLFQHFTKEQGTDTISIDLFINVILDDHMNFEKIRQKIIEYKGKKDRTIKSIYDQYAGPQGSINLHSLQMFFQVLKLDFNMDQLDELFSFLDKNGDGIISYDEFYDAIEKAEVSLFQLLKRMRREFVKAKCDIAKELANRSFGRDTVGFGDFKDCIQQFKVEVKPFEFDALYKKYGKNDYIMYNNFLQDLLSNKYDIEPIKKKIKEYINKEGLNYSSFFDLFTSSPDLLNFPDFQNMLAQCEANIPKDEMLEAFSAFDLNNSRKIHKNEFIDVLEGKIAPQAAIGFNNMLQNAMNYQPMYQMDYSLTTSANMGVTNLLGYAGYGQNLGNVVDNQSIVQSQFVQTQYGLPHRPLISNPTIQNQLQPAIPTSGFAPQANQNNQAPQINVLDTNKEVVLRGDCSVEEVIDQIKQVCQSKFINPFYLFVQIDTKFICGYENESDLEEVLSKGLGMKLRNSHYIDISQRFTIKEKKLLAYQNILKDIIGLISLVRQSMIYSIKAQGITLEVFINNLFTMQKTKQLSADLLKAYIQYSLNITTATQQEVQELFDNIMQHNQEKFTIYDTIASFLSVSVKYDGKMDYINRIDVLTTSGILSQMKQLCSQLRLSLIDVFQYYEDKGLYNITPKQFSKIFEDLDINLTKNQVDSIIQQYQLEGQIQIQYPIYEAETFPETFRKFCFNVMRCMKIGFKDFFLQFCPEKSELWTKHEIKQLFSNFRIYPSEKEIDNLYDVIVKSNRSIYPNQLADFLGIQSNLQNTQCIQYYENILNNVHSTINEYNRNRPALLNKLLSQPPQINPYDAQYLQKNSMFIQAQSQTHFRSPSLLNVNPQQTLNDFEFQRTETVLNPTLPQKQIQFAQKNFYDEPQKRYDQQQQGYDQQNQYERRPYDQNQPGQQYEQRRPYDQGYNQGYDQSRFQDQGFEQRRPQDQMQNQRRYDQEFDQRGFNQSQFEQQNQQFGQYPNQSNLNEPNRGQSNQFDPRRSMNQLEQRNQFQEVRNNSQSQIPFEQNMKNKQIIEEQANLLSISLNNKGGIELINKAGKEGIINPGIFEGILVKFYDMLNSPQLKIFIDSLLDNSNMIQLQTVFNKCQYDHRKFIDNQEINKQLGVGRKQELPQGSKATTSNEYQRVEQIRLTLLDIFKNDFQQLSETYFISTPLIDLQQFLQITKQIFSMQGQQIQQPHEKELEWMFNEVDANQGGTISYNEFELYFAGSEEVVQKKRNKKLSISPQMEQEILELFRIVDVNGDQQINADELNRLFSKIGTFASAQEIEEYIRRYDKNGDRTLGYEEFKMIMEEKIKNEMMTSESIIDDLKKEFKKVDLQNTRSLNIGQLGQVFSNMGVQLKPSELSALFVEIDVDGSRTVDIDELIAFITRNSEGVSTLAQTAILNIRSSRKFSIKDLLDTFKQMPSNYRLSFMRTQFQRGQNLPSSTLRPKVTASLIYSDLHYDNPGIIDNNLSVLDHKYNQSAFQIEMTFKSATGIPIPDANAFPRDQIFKRIAYVTLYDGNRQYLGNTCRVESFWNPNNEDIWEFDKQQFGDQTLLVRFAGYDKNKHTNLNICIELVMNYLPKKSNSKCDLEISVSHVIIPFSNLVRNGEYSFQLNGGEPTKPANIKPEDIRAKRSGVSAFIKTFKKIESQIKININTNITNKSQLNDLAIMPDMILMRRSNLPYFAIYREYFGFRSICKKEIDINLACDHIFKTFSKVVDCPDTVNFIGDFWRNEVIVKIQKLEEQKIAFQKIMNHLYLLFNYDRFAFAPNDPTASVYCFPMVIQERNRLLNLCQEDLRIMLGLKIGQPSNLKIQESSVPFTIEELLDDNQEDDNNMFQEFLARKSSQSILSRK
ncbi:hypothetical protein ABPG72_007121 [Tetrahymena utriculariae]